MCIQGDGTASREDVAGYAALVKELPGWARCLATVPLMRHVLGLLTGRFYVVRGDSMRPGFEPGEYLMISRLAYVRSILERGDVVVVRDPRHISRSFIKRVVGIPGEVVRIMDGVVFVDGREVEEPYLGGLPASLGLGERTWVVGEKEIFLMGDNRSRSTDSRSFGPVGLRLVVGKVWFRWWPPGRLGRIR